MKSILTARGSVNDWSLKGIFWLVVVVWLDVNPSDLPMAFLDIFYFMQFWHQNVVNHCCMFSCKTGYDRFSSVDCNELFPWASFNVTWQPVTPRSNIHSPKSHFGHTQISDFHLYNIFQWDSFRVSKRKVITFDGDVLISNFNVFVFEEQFLFIHFGWFLCKLCKSRI